MVSWSKGIADDRSHGTTLSPMAMGKRKRHAKQTSMWVATQDSSWSAAHPFYTRLNQILEGVKGEGEEPSLISLFYINDKYFPSFHFPRTRV